jgi:protease-4
LNRNQRRKMTMKRIKPLLTSLALLSLLAAAGCAAPRVSLFGGDGRPLKEYTLEGSGTEKVLLIAVKGKIKDSPEPGLLRRKPSVVQEVAAQLRKAETDDGLAAVLMTVDSPGGSVTASDILFQEILRFKQKSGKKLVVALMDLAASGGYYIALPADTIMAHPTTVTGSVGVIFVQPKVADLMDKVGVAVEVSKSGANKDMGSPFRAASTEEKAIVQDLTDRLAGRFLELVAQHRGLNAEKLKEVASARVYLAEDALNLGLVDKVGYLPDAFAEARQLAGLGEDARLVVYRRTEQPDDTVYNSAAEWSGGEPISLVNLGLPLELLDLQTGFYYLWPAATAGY